MKSYYYINNATIGEFLGDKIETLAEAQADAMKWAMLNPGDSLEILRRVGYASASKASTFWMDGEEPPEKPSYRMLDIGEIVADGDEFNYKTSGDWRRHTSWVGMEIGPDNYPTRRPL